MAKSSDDVVGGTAVKQCIPCKKHPFQDSRYGENRRVMNVGKDKAGGRKYTCTVCGKEW